VKTNNKGNFTFIDLFSGIGGFRIAFEKVGGKCVFSSEWDKQCRKTYHANFGDNPSGDITKVKSSDIPSHHILVAGFPCQPFSLAGVVKKKSLNKPVGFEDLTQGTLFFDIARIIKDKRPKAFLLENVKNLKSHDSGKTFRIIEETLRYDLGYTIYSKVIDSRTVVPQHRERIYIVGFDVPNYFQFPVIPDRKPKLADILELNPPQKYTLKDNLWNYLRAYAEKHRSRGNGFGYGLADPNGCSRTLSARYHKDGSEILIPQDKGLNPRRLTPNECALLMGFPRSFKIVVSDTTAYRQFGNAVVVPVVEHIARSMINVLIRNSRQNDITDYFTKENDKRKMK